jgi:hypothetical protein
MVATVLRGACSTVSFSSSWGLRSSRTDSSVHVEVISAPSSQAVRSARTRSCKRSCAPGPSSLFGPKRAGGRLARGAVRELWAQHRVHTH